MAGPKILTLGVTVSEEPEAGGFAYGASGTGGSEPAYLVHAGLTVYDEQGTLQPRLVQRLPTLENGDWKLLPDGRMEVAWQLRPNALWHDGTPLAAEDIMLGFKAGLDPDLGFARGTRVLRQVADVSAPDPQTVLMHWKNTYVFANEMALNTIVPLPRHLLGPLYDSGNKEAFAASPLLSDEWVGLGPYRLRAWQRSSSIEADAFDQYFLGRPKIDRIIIRYVGDTNALVVQIAAGHIHAVPVGTLGEGEAHTLKTQLEAPGTGRVILSPIALVIGQWQLRDPTAPWAQDPRIRMALIKLIDRQALVDTILNGLSEVGDLLLARGDPAYQLAQQRGLPNLSYDPAEAHRLLTAAGWTRDAGGMYRSRDGQPFAVELLASADVNTRVQLALAITNQWKTAGLEATQELQAGQSGRLRDEARARVRGFYYSRQAFGPGFTTQFVTSEIASEATRWRGSNRGGYSNPAYDQLHDRFSTTIESSQRHPIAADMAKLLLDEMAYLPTVTNSEVSAFRKEVRGMTGVSPQFLVSAWNVHLWEMG